MYGMLLHTSLICFCQLCHAPCAGEKRKSSVDGDDLGEILLPTRYVPEDCEIGDWLKVFLYFDSEDLLIATTEAPKVEVGRCEMLKVIDFIEAKL